jgi:N-methylhydantoinase A
VSACSFLGTSMGIENLLAVDMGGTSFDVALVVDGSPRRDIETEVEGYIIRVPMLDIRSIGAGGGSIAWIDEGGGLRVGPHSAGSEPGPVCYGRGGTAPTVSDANAALGYLQTLTGGSLVLDVDGARHALEEEIGSRLGLDAIGAAAGVYRLVNAHMADAMRVIMSEAAMSPADVTLMAYGGAGPVHAAALAREMEIQRTVIPTHPGALSAMGVATGDLVHDMAEAVLLPLDVLNPATLSGHFRSMAAHGRQILEAEGCPPDRMRFEPYFVARYIGQMHDLQVPLPADALDNLALDKLAGEFHDRHREAYGVAVEGEPVLIVSARLRAIGKIQKPALTGHVGTSDPTPERMVRAWFHETGEVDTPLYVRAPWRTGRPNPGPAILQEYDSTTVVLPGQSWHVDEFGSILIEEGGA